jgi:hypothetical protein
MSSGVTCDYATLGKGSGALASASNIGQDAYLMLGDVMNVKPENVHGVIGLSVQDVSDCSTVDSGDRLDYALARVHVPSSNSTLSIKLTGLDITSGKTPFAGVGLMKTIGGDGMGLPRTIGFVTVDGFADISKDGKLLASNLPAHICVVPGIYDTSTETMFSPDKIDYNVRQIALQLKGPISGLTSGDLLIGFPEAALNLNGSGGKVLTASEVTTIALVGAPMTAVAGEAVEVTPRPVLGPVTLSLREGGIRPSSWTLSPGYTRFRVINNSSFSRGAIIKGKDLAGQPFVRYTPILRPGRSVNLHLFLNPGSLVVTEFSRFGATRGMPIMSQFRSILVVSQ